MPSWLMKTGDETYRLWSTVVDDWLSEPMDREEATTVAIARACADNPDQMEPYLALKAGEETMRFVDEHRCSCRARLGENVEIRNGVPIATGGGRLAYHFASYDEVARFCRTQKELLADDSEESET